MDNKELRNSLIDFDMITSRVLGATDSEQLIFSQQRVDAYMKAYAERLKKIERLDDVSSYSMLCNGDRIVKGDQWLKDSKEWVYVSDYEINHIYRDINNYPMRRKL